MKRKLSGVVRSITPRFIWNAYLRSRGLGVHQIHPWRTFGLMATRADAGPLLEGRFAELYAKYSTIDPTIDPEQTRYRHYCNCVFAYHCRNVPGDFVCAGISYGVSAKMIFEYTDFENLGKTLHLIDPFEGVAGEGRIAADYNRDPDYVRKQYPPDARVVMHRERIPLHLPRPLAFVMTATGVPEAEEASIPIFYEALSPGGILLSGRYRELPSIIPLWMPSGVAVYFKH
jgi:hypothetical protein